MGCLSMIRFAFTALVTTTLAVPLIEISETNRTICGNVLPRDVLGPRQEGLETNIAVENDVIMTFGSYVEHPPAFNTLWDNVVAASCNEIRCGEEIGTTSAPWIEPPRSGAGNRIEMFLEGDFFTAGIRDEMVDLLRMAFDRAVRTEPADNGYQVYEFGPRDLYAITSERDTLRVVLRRELEGEGCGDIVNRILSVGALVHPAFGVIGVACA